MTADSPELQSLLKRLFPELIISGVAKPSGQRVVYYCSFVRPQSAEDINGANEDWSHWGEVVMKVSSGIDPMSIAYLQMEIAVLNSLNSPCYPKLHYFELFSYDPDTEERLKEPLFVTIENRVNAEPLSVCRNRFTTEAAVVDLLHKLVNALSLLWGHEKQLVHRDLKPDNILVHPNGDVTIIDLGILRETGAVGITATHAHFGPLTAEYSSPEQATNDKQNISFKSDVFALATIAYELIAGSNPYVTRTGIPFYEILSNVTTLVPNRLDVDGRCSSGLCEVLEKMMHKEPYKRYRSPELLRTDLEKLGGTKT